MAWTREVIAWTGGVGGGGEKLRVRLNTELTGFLDELAVEWEGKGGVKAVTKVFDLISWTSSGEFTRNARS